jgi:hypothetical protein
VTSFVEYNHHTVRRLMSSSPAETIRAIQDGPCHFLWLMAVFAAEESGLDAEASSLVYVRHFETEVFFFQMESKGQNIAQRRFIYNGEDFWLRREHELEGPTSYFPVEGDGLSQERRDEIMTCIRELVAAEITFLCPTGQPLDQPSK